MLDMFTCTLGESRVTFVQEHIIQYVFVYNLVSIKDYYIFKGGVTLFLQAAV